jgi:hypothetical protein
MTGVRQKALDGQVPAREGGTLLLSNLNIMKIFFFFFFQRGVNAAHLLALIA